MSKEQDKIFFRNFSLALGFIASMMVVFFIIAQFAAGTDDEAGEAIRSAKVAEVTEPVGQVTAVGEETEEMMQEATEEMVAEAPAAGEASGDVGETVYKGLCVNCHGIAAMASMIPQTGDADAWSARIEQGIDTLYDHAINGFTGSMGMMPARGSNPALSDDEVKAAVDYMINQAK
jgi:cytochrome c5